MGFGSEVFESCKRVPGNFKCLCWEAEIYFTNRHGDSPKRWDFLCANTNIQPRSIISSALLPGSDCNIPTSYSVWFGILTQTAHTNLNGVEPSCTAWYQPILPSFEQFHNLDEKIVGCVCQYGYVPYQMYCIKVVIYRHGLWCQFCGLCIQPPHTCDKYWLFIFSWQIGCKKKQDNHGLNTKKNFILTKNSKINQLIARMAERSSQIH